MRSSPVAYLENIRSRWAVFTAGILAVFVGAGSVASPKLVVASAVVLVFAAVAARSLPAGLAGFTILIFFGSIPGLGSSGLIKAAGGVLTVIWLAGAMSARRDRASLVRDHPILASTAILLLGWTFSSALWAVDPGRAGLTALRLSQSVVLFFVVFAAIQNRTHLRWIVSAFIAGAVVSALVGLAGVTSPEASNASGPAVARLTGGIGDPNELAASLVPALGFVVFMLAASRTILARWLLLGCAGVLALALLRTESRGGIVALSVMLIATVLFAGPARLRIITAIMATAAVAIFFFLATGPPPGVGRLTEFRAGGGSGRTDLWAVALQITHDHPLAGVGAGNFPVVEPDYAIRNINLPRADLIVDVADVTHNTYLQLLSELGVVGLALFSALILGAIAAAVRAVRKFADAGDSEMEMLSRGLVIGTVGMLGAFVFLSAQYEKPLPLVLGTLVALSTVAQVHQTRQLRPREHESWQSMRPAIVAEDSLRAEHRVVDLGRLPSTEF
ncbi:MAG: O-antigen ligase family protein [Actinomycetota bacterium]|nr:O-antigen ligase family protein [Actinomycetota bacterium]